MTLCVCMGSLPAFCYIYLLLRTAIACTSAVVAAMYPSPSRYIA